MKRAISYLISLIMVFAIMPNIVFANDVDDQANVENESLTLYIEQSNEIFEEGNIETTVEVIDIEPFSVEEENIAPNGSDAIQYAETVEEAAVDLRAAMVERQENAVVNMKVDELTEEALTIAADQIFKEAIKHTGNPKEGDSLKWVWDNCGVSISGSSDGTNCYATITYDITYYTTAVQEATLTSTIESLKEELNLEGKTDYEIIKAIYDYMVANISYDYTNLKNDSHKLKYTAYAALVNKTSVCQGYATLFYRMALEYGIDTRVIAGVSLNNKGKAERHAWNIVKLDDKYYNLDSTWDSTWDNNITNHDFLLQGTDTFENHTRDDEFTTAEFNVTYPMSKIDYVYGIGGDVDNDDPENVHIHEIKKISGVSATCTEDGNIEHYKCSKCEKLYADAEGKIEITKADIIDPSTGHSYSDWQTDADNHWKECNCGDVIEKAAHDFEWKVDIEATEEAEGSKCQKCTVCNKQSKTKTIYKASKVLLSKENYTYDGGKKTPAVTVKDSKGNTIDKSNYSLSYATGRAKVGRYKVTVTFKGDYKGTKAKTAYFTIVPKAPSSASAILYGYDDVKFSWNKSTGASGYNVYYKKSTSSKYTYLTRTTKTSIKKANLSDGVKYYFKIVPYYKAGDTRYPALTYKTASVYTLKKLNTPVVKKSGTKVKVTWKNISGETGYQISQSTKSGGTKVVATYKTTKGTYKNITAKKGTKYYYKVRAYKQVGKTKIYGPWSKVKAYKR